MTRPAVSGSGTSVDEILDVNAVGLLYFERFLPLVFRVPGSDCPPYEHVRARYDEQRGLNLGALGNDADAVEAMSAVLGDELEEQIRLRRVLQLRWHGEAGEAAQTFLSAEQEKAAELILSIEDSHQTMCAAVDVLRDAVIDKAELVGGLDVDGVDGKTVDQIDAILVASGIECLPVDRESVFPRLSSAFDDLAERARSADVSDEFAVEVTQRCRDWIDSEFVPRVKGTCDSVIDACTATDTAVRDCLKLVVDVLGSVHDPAFTDLDERGWAVTPGAAGVEPAERPRGAADAPWQASDVLPADRASGGTESVPSAEGGSAAVAPAAVSAPNEDTFVGAGSVDPAGARTTDDLFAEKLGNSLDGLVDRVVAEIVDRVDEALTDTIDGAPEDRNTADRNADGRDQEDHPAEDRSASRIPPDSDGGSALPDDTADHEPASAQLPPTEQSSPIATDERGHLEAELDGHRARIALEHDGAVSLELETPGLGVRSFELRIGPFGIPEIVEVPGAVDAVEAPAAEAASPSEPVPAQEAVPATDAVPAAEAAPAAEPVAATEPALPSEPAPPSDSDSDGQAQCPPEPSDAEHPVAQHPVTSDRAVAGAQPTDPDPGTGAGLSEAGVL